MAGKNPFIRYTLAGFLLVLFAFSITPKKTLHDIITHHTDQASYNYSETDQVNKAGFNCKTESLVAESPFTSYESVFEFATHPVYAQPATAAIRSYKFSLPTFFSLRGPPSNV